jgi:hypothetical protein
MKLHAKKHEHQKNDWKLWLKYHQEVLSIDFFTLFFFLTRCLNNCQMCLSKGSHNLGECFERYTTQRLPTNLF